MVQLHIDTQQIHPSLLPYMEKLQGILSSRNWESKEASILLPSEKKITTDAERITSSFSPALKIVIVIGIGGSNLGTKAIYEALSSTTKPLSREVLFADTTDTDALSGFKSRIQALFAVDEVALLFISKSGTTTESAANFSVLLKMLEAKFGTFPGKQVVCITDEQSKLEQFAIEKGYQYLSIPKSVGGRYSVFSSVGLLPLTLAGVDTNALLSGAQKAIQDGISPESIAGKVASFLFDKNQKGYAVQDMFLFEPKLETIGKWYRQLCAESLGKQSKGLLPTVSIGSTDLHSIGQYYLGGPRIVMTEFVSSAKHETFSVDGNVTSLVPAIGEKTVDQIHSAILQAVMKAYSSHQIPYIHLILDEINEESIGAFLQIHMLSIMFLGTLLAVDAFDQPNVEDYKTELRSLLTV